MSLTSFFKGLGVALLLASVLGGCNESGKPLLQVGEKAPDFTLQLISGSQATLSQYSGKGLVVTFMASWCPCSNESMPLMKKAFEKHNSDIAFLMIGIQDSESKFDGFIKKWEVPFAAGFDDGDQIAKVYGVRSPPTTFFIGRDGIVKRAFYGNIKEQEDQFPGWIEELL